MSLKRLLIALAASFLGFAPWAVCGAAKPILVYYMPWFVAKPYSESWGWHWTMDKFNPDIIEASGQRQIASWYRPLIGPYDSADPVVLEYHALLFKLSGIDGVIVDWYGADDHLDYAINNERTLAMRGFARKAGLTFALCYEDRTVQQEIHDGFLKADDAIAHAQGTMRYAESNYFGEPHYLRWQGRPVLLNFGPQYFKENAQWEEIFAALDPTNRPAFFTEDNRLPIGAGAFNWPPMWMSRAPGAQGVLSTTALESYLDRFEEAASEWPAFISSAFPRFHDVYQSAGMREYWGYLGDRKGQTFQNTLVRALTNRSAMVQIVTWNDFGEGTVVEPTVEYGFRDLAVIQEQRRQHIDPKFNFGKDDLAIALRLYRMRRAAGTNAATARALDQTFSEIVRGDLHAAKRRLAELETSLQSPAER